jgi:hypothetical protein
MSKQTNSTRRSFLKSGAILAAPFAAAAPAAVLADDGLNARLARLENETAIRELHQEWLRRVNSGARGAAAQLFREPAAARNSAVRAITADHSGERDAIDVAANGTNATGRFSCLVEIESVIPRDSTLGQMAHAQGNGFVPRTERRVLRVAYAKSGSSWAIAKVEFASV